MERNVTENNQLKNLFQAIVLNGLNEELIEDVKNILIDFLDTKNNNNIFNDTYFYSLLILLKSQKQLPILFSYLLNEIDLKILRLNIFKDEKKCDNNCKEFTTEKLKGLLKVTEEKLLPAKGETGQVRKKINNDEEEHEYFYVINDQGEVVEILEHYMSFLNNRDRNSYDDLNDSPLSKLKEKYLKENNNQSLTENDLE